jgi:methionyl aminopeptidase
LGLPPSYFCSQPCFKTQWATHKLVHNTVHKTPEQILIENRPEFKDFIFTGSLRPGLLSPKRILPENITRPEYADDPSGTPHREVGSRANTKIPVYSQEVIQNLREAGKLAAEVLAAAGKMTKPGIATDEIDRVVHEKCIELECYPSPLNYYNFPKSVCTSVNEVICHGIPDSRELQDGDICNVDVTVYYKGVHADLNETWLIGNVSPQHTNLVTTAYNCLNAAIEAVRPGMLYRELGNIINRVATKAGCQVVRTYCGHGIGELFHTIPNVPHYANNKAVGVMQPGNIFTIEPMINQGKWGDVLWPDEWTAVTKDGKWSAQFEHTLLVTKTGVEVLTARTQGTYKDRF